MFHQSSWGVVYRCCAAFSVLWRPVSATFASASIFTALPETNSRGRANAKPKQVPAFGSKNACLMEITSRKSLQLHFPKRRETQNWILPKTPF